MLMDKKNDNSFFAMLSRMKYIERCSYDGVVTRTAKRRVTEVRLTPAEKPEPEKDDDEKSHYGRMTSK